MRTEATDKHGVLHHSLTLFPNSHHSMPLSHPFIDSLINPSIHSSIHPQLNNFEVDVMEADPEQNTCLHWAAWHGYFRVAQLLLNRGANPNAENKKLQTPLHWAASYGKPSVIGLLVQHGSRVEATDTDGFTPVMAACQLGKIYAVALFREFGADLFRTDRNSRSLLHWAAFKGDPILVQYLLHLGLGVGDQDQQGMLPLHWAAQCNHPKALEIMVEELSSPRLLKITDEDGMTPHRRAWSHNADEAAKVLHRAALRFSGPVWGRVFRGKALKHWGNQAFSMYFLLGGCVSTLHYLFWICPFLHRYWTAGGDGEGDDTGMSGWRALGLLLAGFYGLCMVGTAALWFRVRKSDPGFVPRQSHPEIQVSSGVHLGAAGNSDAAGGTNSDPGGISGGPSSEHRHPGGESGRGVSAQELEQGGRSVPNSGGVIPRQELDYRWSVSLPIFIFYFYFFESSLSISEFHPFSSEML